MEQEDKTREQMVGSNTSYISCKEQSYSMRFQAVSSLEILFQAINYFNI
jgi:hypothetical protein